MISISVIVGIAVGTFQKDVFYLDTVFQDSLNAQKDTRNALASMSAEIRSASPSSVGAYPLAETATSSFTFYSDIDGDGLKERVRYFLNGKTLKKGVLEPSGNPLSYNPVNEIISDFVKNITNGTSSPIFAYYDDSYDGSTAPLPSPVNILSVSLVKITAVVDSNPGRAPIPLTLTTQMSIRNLKDNF